MCKHKQRDRSRKTDRCDSDRETFVTDRQTDRYVIVIDRYDEQTDRYRCRSQTDIEGQTDRQYQYLVPVEDPVVSVSPSVRSHTLNITEETSLLHKSTNFH